MKLLKIFAACTFIFFVGFFVFFSHYLTLTAEVKDLSIITDTLFEASELSINKKRTLQLELKNTDFMLRASAGYPADFHPDYLSYLVEGVTVRAGVTGKPRRDMVRGVEVNEIKTLEISGVPILTLDKFNKRQLLIQNVSKWTFASLSLISLSLLIYAFIAPSQSKKQIEQSHPANPRNAGG